MITEQDINKGKQNAIISYITPFGVIIAYYLNNEPDKQSPFVSFHIRQSLGLWLTFLALGYPVGGFDSIQISASFWVFFVTLWLYGALGASSGKLNLVPIVGKFYQKIFANLGN